ncbi:DUF4038 domain-containing protein [Runella sp. CRIBMP]|uniref:apiosidase-like domain-containing protein n=1 Tax=Runella sp. CRIBMP TaxID=2683261 RepID=UPI0014135C87|nr:DUF4038 domain-containing protein [Runella sp. CRIBMP]NBB20457.1 DUF4038 domain-containing protein [Runella sp. CRIBMP]
MRHSLFTVLLLVLLIPSLFAQKKRRVTKKAKPVPTVTVTQNAFPLKISRDGRYLTNRNGQAFLMNADAGWTLFHKLKMEEARFYLEHRYSKHFNTIFVQLLPPEPNQTNAYGEAPFARKGDFAAPNEKYFAYVDNIIKMAARMQLLVAIVPAWLGCCGTNWFEAQTANGTDKCRDFGRYLGRRFGNHSNILWIMGGDRDPLREEAVQRAMAEGIKETAPTQLMTYHAASSHSSTDVFPAEKWLDFSMVYTYFRGKQGVWTSDMPQVYEVALKETQKSPRKAFILGESQYEDENVGNALMIRRQAYWSLLGGGSGQCYGSSVWAFGEDWRQKLDLPGVAQMNLFQKIMNGLPWYLFRPDTTSNLLVEGRGTYGSDDYGVVSILPNNRMAMIYLPSSRTIKVNVEKINGSNIRALWISPRTNNRFIGGYFKPQGVRELIPPTLDEDWLLLLGNVGRK